MEEKEKEIKEESITIEISKELERGVYSNVASIIHSQEEFILDFGLSMPNRAAVVIQSRIITNPQHAKKFMLALQDNIKKYERKYGKIELEKHPFEIQSTGTLEKLH
jgi:hypothetical protein